jgi:hypothetical protein
MLGGNVDNRADLESTVDDLGGTWSSLCEIRRDPTWTVAPTRPDIGKREVGDSVVNVPD